jgi:hypothetical protein
LVSGAGEGEHAFGRVIFATVHHNVQRRL